METGTPYQQPHLFSPTFFFQNRVFQCQELCKETRQCKGLCKGTAYTDTLFRTPRSVLQHSIPTHFPGQTYRRCVPANLHGSELHPRPGIQLRWPARNRRKHAIKVGLWWVDQNLIFKHSLKVPPALIISLPWIRTANKEHAYYLNPLILSKYFVSAMHTL